MKTRAKVGNKKGNPAYRTPSSFKVRKSMFRYQQIKKLGGDRNYFLK